MDTRLVEAVPWVLSTYTDLDWGLASHHARLRNAQNRLGYLVYLATSTAPAAVGDALSKWKLELEEARLASEGTLCRDSMAERENDWLTKHRPDAAAHWNLLTSLSADQLPYTQR